MERSDKSEYIEEWYKGRVSLRYLIDFQSLASG